MSARKPIKMLRSEKWQLLKGHISGGPIAYKYAVSNYGRVVKFSKNLANGYLLNLSLQQGFPIWRKIMNGKYFAVLIHRLVAKHFLPKPSANQKFVIHSDYNKENNYYKNLQWASQEEVTAHAKNNPAIIKAKERMRKSISKGGYNTKLTDAKVKYIKKSLAKGKTLKELALKFKVSDMQIHRIKTGENWGHIK
jgi:HNH endonuclease/NUMOD4 motif